MKMQRQSYKQKNGIMVLAYAGSKATWRGIPYPGVASFFQQYSVVISPSPSFHFYLSYSSCLLA
ncbi:hypothetical protein M404DRAFT_861708 [Pisolithus tinctorius Marx 270]|uniref:Uncharacterized protein n=1 Tax=Pisolithus tinctorius Marx 270 TaxID=870435 RepID=A0A0C3NS32_PISTI|nr:hypothetical protein M404DRAFT_861708 [Pisolithus tinctorius Marx 270]